jgi:hypothetical protein
MSKKVQIKQDDLRDLLDGYHFKRVRLAEQTGLSEASLNVCFLHKPGSTGKPRYFTPDAIRRINEALPRLADGIRDCVLTFGGDKKNPNVRGNVYDKSLRELINNNIGRYLNITLMVWDLFGWNQKKKEAILGSTSKASGNITEEHVMAINKHLLNISGNLSGLELVADDDSSDSSTSTDN